MRIAPWFPSGTSIPAIIRKSVVLPEPDGPSSATNSPVSTLKLTSLSAAKFPNFFPMLRISVLLLYLIPRPLRIFAAVELRFPIDQCLERNCHQRQNGEQRRHGKSRRRVILVVEYLGMEWDRVGRSSNMAGHDGHGTELSHCPRVAQNHPVQEPPFNVGQSHAPK